MAVAMFDLIGSGYSSNSVSLRSTKDGTSRPGSIATDNRTITVHDLPENAVVTRAVVSVWLRDIGAYGSNLQTCTVNDTEVRSGGNDVPQENLVRVEIHGNRDLTLTFVYQINQYISGNSWTVTFYDISLRVEYELEEDPGYRDDEILIPAKGVMLYDSGETDFTKNGLTLHPMSCCVTEEAGGSYELTMEHPQDDRWEAIVEEAIIKAPVPPHKIPEVTIQPGKIWRVVIETPLYTRLPTYTSAGTAVDKAQKDPASMAWTARAYEEGHIVTHSNKVYMANANTDSTDEPGVSTKWSYVQDVSTSSTSGVSGGTYDAGEIAEMLAVNATITYLADYNAKWMKVRSPLGREGYVSRYDCEETQTAAAPIIIPERTIYTQLFRVYSVACDEAEKVVTVTARHISYDYQRNMLFDCQMEDAEPATAVAMVQGNVMNPDERLIACPIEYPLISADWSFANPLQAILDPEDGLAGQLNARILRDNKDFFVLPQTPARIGARLAYGVNLIGVSWERNSDELVTRVIPRANDGESGYVYLDELYIDSPHIDDYAVVYTEVLDSKYSVGQEITKPDGTKQTLSRSSIIERMRQEAENRYYVDGADKVAVSLDVEFVLLGDTEEYRQYRNLQRVNLYDRIPIDTGSTSVDAQVVGYEWDCLMGRYNSISIGKVYSMGRRRLPGYRVATGAITYSKLAPGLISWIRGES